MKVEVGRGHWSEGGGLIGAAVASVINNILGDSHAGEDQLHQEEFAFESLTVWRWQEEQQCDISLKHPLLFPLCSVFMFSWICTSPLSDHFPDRQWCGQYLAVCFLVFAVTITAHASSFFLLLFFPKWPNFCFSWGEMQKKHFLCARAVTPDPAHLKTRSNFLWLVY